MAGKWLAAKRRIKCKQCSARRIFAASDSQSFSIPMRFASNDPVIRHCERSEAIQAQNGTGFLRRFAPR
jgi:hypothetical protein